MDIAIAIEHGTRCRLERETNSSTHNQVLKNSSLNKKSIKYIQRVYFSQTAGKPVKLNFVKYLSLYRLCLCSIIGSLVDFSLFQQYK